MSKPNRHPAWVKAAPTGAILSLRAVPRAKRTEIADASQDALRIRLQAPPLDGKANKVLLHFLSDRLSVPRSDLELLTGATARLKRIEIRGLMPSQVVARLTLEKAVALKTRVKITVKTEDTKHMP